MYKQFAIQFTIPANTLLSQAISIPFVVEYGGQITHASIVTQDNTSLVIPRLYIIRNGTIHIQILTPTSAATQHQFVMTKTACFNAGDILQYSCIATSPDMPLHVTLSGYYFDSGMV